MHRSRRHGFTLVEILIVVVILGILAAIVVPQFSNTTESARQSSFISDLKALASAAEVYTVRENQYLGDGSSGQVPAGFESYIRVSDFTGGTPIGGVWDVEFQDAGGVTSAIGVHFNGSGATRNDAYMLQIDDLFDDGNLATGLFRKLENGRYYYVLAD